MRVELTDERRSALRIAIDALRDTIAGFEPTKQQQIAATVLRAMLEEPSAVEAIVTKQAVQRLRAVEGELRPTTNRTTQAKVMISQYSEDWHKWADEIAAVADSLEWK